MKRIVLTLIFLVFIKISAFADVTIRVIDVKQKIMRVTYTWNCCIPGESSGVLPNLGYTFTKYPIKVISVIEKNTDQNIEFNIVSKRNGQALELFYPNPIPKGGSYTIEVIIEAKTDNIKIDSEGRYVFNYETTHEAFFVLPEGHALVYANYPVLIYERKNSTACHINGTGKKNLIFKTRAYKKR